MAPKKVTRMPWTPTALKPEWISQTVRLAVRDNNRLKRAAKRQKMTFNAWAVKTLTEEADRVLTNPKKAIATLGAVIQTINRLNQGEDIGEASK